MFGNNRQRNPFFQQPGRRGRQRPRFGTGTTWKDQLLAVAIAAASFGVWYGTPVSHWITDILLLQIPVEDDINLGRAALQGFSYRTVYDSHWTPLLQAVGSDLVKTYRREAPYDPYQWDFAVIRADFINAFALPGGTIRVTSSLLQALQPSRGELAALLGHEMGHVLHRHSQAHILQHQLIQNVLEALLGDSGGGGNRRDSFGQSLGKLLAKSAQWLGEQSFSRRDEYQADATGWDLLVRSGRYNPQSLHSLLSKLERQEERHRNAPDDPLTRAITEWSRTHPATADRLKALDREWNALPQEERRRLARHAV